MMASPSVVLCSVKPTISSVPERRLAKGERRADRQPFAKVVQADPDRDEQRQHPAAAAVRHRAPPRLDPRADPFEQPDTRPPPQVRTAPRPGTTRAGTPAASRPSVAPSTSRNASSPIVSASRKSIPRCGDARDEGKPQQPDHHRDDADIQPDEREDPEEAGARPRRLHRDRESRARTPCRSRSGRARRAFRPAPTDTESAASSVRDAGAPCRCSAVNVQNASSTTTCEMVTGSGPSFSTVARIDARLEHHALERQALDRRKTVAAHRIGRARPDDGGQQGPSSTSGSSASSHFEAPGISDRRADQRP